MRIRATTRALGLGLMLAILVAACIGAGSSVENSPRTEGSPGTAPEPSEQNEGSGADRPSRDEHNEGIVDEPGADVTPAVPPGPNESTPTVAGCDAAPSALPWTAGPTSQAIRIADQPLTVDAAVYPRPSYEGRPWSQWGQGVVTPDGRFFSAIGDHLGADGNAYLYDFNPETGALTQIADAQSLANHEPGAWGYGKVHAQMVPGRCGDVFVATYWGTRRDLVFGNGYEGDLLFRLDPQRQTIANLGVLHDRHGVPSLASAPELGLLYAEAVDPLAPPGGSGTFVATDMTTGETVFAHHDPSHSGFRSIAVAADGEAFYSLGEGRLARFSPATRGTEITTATVPGDIVRAVTVPTPSGSILGVTDGPPNFFEMTTDGQIRTIGPASGYTTSVVASLDGTTIYSVPDAHGGAWRNGTPLIATDVGTGESRTLMELNDPAVAQLGLRLGGTYSLALSPDGSALYIGMNAAPPDGDREAFGEVVLLIVELP